MCVGCASGAAAAVGCAAGIRAWLATSASGWLTPARLRYVTWALLSLALLASGFLSA